MYSYVNSPVGLSLLLVLVTLLCGVWEDGAGDDVAEVRLPALPETSPSAYLAFSASLAQADAKIFCNNKNNNAIHKMQLHDINYRAVLFPENYEKSQSPLVW